MSRARSRSQVVTRSPGAARRARPASPSRCAALRRLRRRSRRAMPQVLRLERQRTRIAVGQRMLHAFEEPLRGTVVTSVDERLRSGRGGWGDLPSLPHYRRRRTRVSMGRPAYPRPPLVLSRARLVAALVALVRGCLRSSPPRRRRSGATLQTRLGRALELVGDSGCRPRRRSCVDLQTGKVVFQRNAERALQPASNQKLAVTLAALDELGPRFRIPTRVLRRGPSGRSDVWRGRLVVKGYGDPTLSREDLKQARARGQVARASAE